MAWQNDAETGGEESFRAQWEEFWEEMAELNQDLEEQQSVTRKTLGLVFDV